MLQAASSCRFGVFEVNLQARELRKHGTRVKLSGHSFQILAMLLERPGEIVTREQLRARLWPADTFVDFEHGLNTAVKRLRATLGDSPDNPRYIETLPRVGYRFIAPVETLSNRVNPTPPTGETPFPQQKVSSQATTPRRGTAAWTAVSLSGVLLSIVLGWILFPEKAPQVISTTRLTWTGHIDDWANLVTDGPRIYFLERNGARWNVMQTSTQGGSSQPLGMILPGPNAEIQDISRDVSQMLVSTFVMRDTEMPLWSSPIQGGAPLRMGSIETKYAVWTPDGKGVLYSHEKDLLVADATGRNPRKLLTASGRIFDFSFSPNGKVIRFSIQNPHTAHGELWETAADGSGIHRLFPDWAKPPGECCGRWTPDGRYYVFLAWQGDRTGVCAVREYGGFYSWKHPAPVNLISGPTQFSRVTPSRDGRLLFALGQNLEGDMMRYDQKLRTLVSLPGLPRGSPVLYSPAEEWIVYQSSADFSLWRSKADGSQPLQLTPPLSWIADPQWSSDGNQIVFMGGGHETDQGTQVYVLPRDGGEPRRVFPQRGWQFHPHWLPEGESVAISVRPFEGEKEPSPGIYVASVATQEAHKLPGSQDIDSAVWSPNGHLVAGETRDYHRIKLYDVGQNTWTDAVTGTLFSGMSWASDSQALYYQDVLEEYQPIYRFWLASMRREKVYDFHNELNSGYFRCLFYGVKPDGSLLVYLSRSQTDLYAFDIDFP